MPKPKKKNIFIEGKYGTKSACTQAYGALNQLQFIYGAFSPEMDQEIQTIISQIKNKPKNLKEHFINGYSFDGDVSPETAEKLQNDLKNLSDKYHQSKEKNPKANYYSGYLAVTEKLLDTEAGDFGRAMVENSYLSELIHQHHNGPLVGDKISIDDSIRYLDEVDPITHEPKKGPLQYLNKFFSITADLLQREYDKQKVLDDYTPEKEADYLSKLNNDFKAMLENYSILEGYVNEDGKSEYDRYLNNKLDTFTRKDVRDANSRRTAKANIENIRGQQKAIENGWGMNELDFAGKVSELDWLLETELKVLKLDVDPANIEKTKMTKIRNVTILSRQVKEFNEKLQNTKVKNASDKILLADEFKKIASAKLVYSKDVKNALESTVTFCDHSMRFGGRKMGAAPEVISKEVQETSMTPEEIELYGPFFTQNGKFVGWMGVSEPVDSIYPNLVLSLSEEYGDKNRESFEELDNEGRLDDKKYGGKRGGMAVEMSVAIQEKDKQDAVEFSNKAKVLMDEALLRMKGYQNDMKRACKSLSTLNEVENGNVMRAMMDRDYLLNFFTQTSGNALEAFGNRKDPREVSRHLKEVGALDAINDFNEAGNDFFLTEFDRQRMEKFGWNEEKERLYMAKLDECMTKSIDAFERMMELPLDVQEETEYMGNSIGHATGNDASATTRDIMPQLIGLKWMKEGIRLGYNSKDIEVLSVGGKIEGNIRRAKCKITNHLVIEEKKLKDLKAKYRAEYNSLDTEGRKKLVDSINSSEETIRMRKELYNYLDEFENDKFRPLKESILSRKVESPSDVIKTITQLQEFYHTYKSDPKFGPATKIYADAVSIFADTVPAFEEKYFKDVINDKLKELETMKPGEKLPELNRSFKICDKSMEIAAFKESVKEADINDKEFLKTAASAFFHNAFLNGMNIDAHPEYFDSNHPDYTVSNQRLVKYSEQYADRILEIMQPKSAAEFYNLLENGDHKEFFSSVKDRVSADASKSRFNSFISGKPPRFANVKSIGEARKGLVEASVKGSSSGLYKDIISNLEKLEKMKTEISREMLSQERTGHSVKIVDYELDKFGKPNKKKPIYKMENGKEVKLDPEKLKAYKALQESTANQINKYLNSKDEIIKKKGGNPAKENDHKKLGETGERHYKAMLDAKNSLNALNKATIEFEQHGITYAERNITKMPGFDVSPSEYLRDSTKVSPEEEKKAYDKFIAEEKERYVNNLKYNLLEKNKKLRKDLVDENLKQYAHRTDLKRRFNDIKNPTEEQKKAYEDALFDSAIKTLYSNTIRNNFDKKLDEQFSNFINESQMNADKAFKEAENKYKEDYSKLVDEYEPAGMNPPEAEKKKLLDVFDEQKKIHDNITQANAKYTKYLSEGKYPADVMDKLSVKTLTTINEGLQNGKTEYFMKNPEQIREFKKQVIDNAPFKTEFKKQVIEMAKEKYITNNDILKIRDNIIKNSAVKHEKNPEELKKLDGLSKVLGSKVSSEAAIKQAKVAQRNAAKQNIEKVSGPAAGM